MAKLTLDTFKSDIQHLVIRYNDVDKRNAHIESLINDHYLHIKNECNAYLYINTNSEN